MPKPKWSLPHLLAGLHEDIEKRLSTARKTFAHAPTKGDASENVWLELLNTYLPKRYQAAKAHVVDSKGDFSEQIDVLVFDRQYSPFIFNYEGPPLNPSRRSTLRESPTRGRKLPASGGFCARAFRFRTRAALFRRRSPATFSEAFLPSKATGIHRWISPLFRLWRAGTASDAWTSAASPPTAHSAATRRGATRSFPKANLQPRSFSSSSLGSRNWRQCR